MIQAATDRFLLPTVTRSEAQILRCWGQGRACGGYLCPRLFSTAPQGPEQGDGGVGCGPSYLAHSYRVIIGWTTVAGKRPKLPAAGNTEQMLVTNSLRQWK